MALYGPSQELPASLHPRTITNICITMPDMIYNIIDNFPERTTDQGCCHFVRLKLAYPTSILKN